MTRRRRVFNQVRGGGFAELKLVLDDTSTQSGVSVKCLGPVLGPFPSRPKLAIGDRFLIIIIISIARICRCSGWCWSGGEWKGTANRSEDAGQVSGRQLLWIPKRVLIAGPRISEADEIIQKKLSIVQNISEVDEMQQKVSTV